MFLGILVDQYGADKGMTSKQTMKMVEKLAYAQKLVHGDIGMPSRSE